MAQTPQQRRAAQRRNAAALRRGESVIEDIGEQIRSFNESERFAADEAPEDEVLLTYRPTKTTWPGNGWRHRRTVAAGYNRNTQTLRIQFFTDGAQYDYYDVPPSVARQFRRAESPGKFINAILNNYSYEKII